MTVDLSAIWDSGEAMLAGFLALLPSLCIGVLVPIVFVFIGKGIAATGARIAARATKRHDRDKCERSVRTDYRVHEGSPPAHACTKDIRVVSAGHGMAVAGSGRSYRPGPVAWKPDRQPWLRMQNHLRSIALLLGLALVPACAGTKADETRPVEEPRQSATQPEATNTRSLTMSGIYLDPELARLCGIASASPAAFFEFDSAKIDSADNSGLLAVATCVSTGPLKGRQIQIIGHTDPRGTDDYNTQLGKTRADSVMQFLANKGGVPADRMTALSEGETGADPTDASDWPHDRRVDIRLAA